MLEDEVGEWNLRTGAADGIFWYLEVIVIQFLIGPGHHRKAHFWLLYGVGFAALNANPPLLESSRAQDRYSPGKPEHAGD